MTGCWHPLFTRLYTLARWWMEPRGGADHRRELLACLEGRVLEVGAGSGLNFEHYPPTVTEVDAIEPEPHFRARAFVAAQRAPVSVHVMHGFADALPFPDGMFDAAVCSLMLCSVPDPVSSLIEIGRVLRPGGELRFYEHVRGTGRIALLQDVFDPVWSRVAAGCHMNRDAVAAIEQAGFKLERVRRFDFIGWVMAPHVLGLARSPVPGT